MPDFSFLPRYNLMFFSSKPMLFDQPLPPSGQRVRYAAPQGSGDALALAQLAGKARPLVIFTESAWQAQRLHDEIPYFGPELSVHLLPDWETLPYDNLSPHQDLISERLATLHQIEQNRCDVVIVPVTTALYRLPPIEFLAAYTFFLKQGETLDLEALRSRLTLAGYTHVTQVLSPGEFSIRGGLIDLFPMGSAVPYRIDLFDQDIESIRTFDVDTQRSIYPVKDVRLLPAREFAMDEAGITRFRQAFRERFEGDPSRSQLYKDVSNGLTPSGVEYYLPLFFDKTAVVFDYLPKDALVIMHHDLDRAARDFWRDTQSRYDLLKGDRDRPLLPPQDLFLPADAFFSGLKSFPRIEITLDTTGKTTYSCATAALPQVQVERRAENPLHMLKTFVEEFHGRVIVLAESMGRRETMLEYFINHGLKPGLCDGFADCMTSAVPLSLGIGPLSTGFVLPDSRMAFITENEL